MADEYDFKLPPRPESHTTRSTLSTPPLLPMSSPSLYSPRLGERVQESVATEEDTEDAEESHKGLRRSLRRCPRLRITMECTTDADVEDNADVPLYQDNDSNSDDVDEVQDYINSRISAAIAYTRLMRSKNEAPLLYTQFELPKDNPPSRALYRLRLAHQQGLATFIMSGPLAEAYEMAIPPPVHDHLNHGIDPQWWVGKTKKEIKEAKWQTKDDLTRDSAHRQTNGLKLKSEEMVTKVQKPKRENMSTKVQKPKSKSSQNLKSRAKKESAASTKSGVKERRSKRNAAKRKMRKTN